MEEHKRNFISFLISTGALKVEPDNSKDFGLKSGRKSPWFLNIGDFNDGFSTRALGEAYRDALKASGIPFDILYGIPEKGNGLAVATAIAFSGERADLPWFFTRKVPKEYGEASNLTPAERIKALVVGRAPREGQKIAQLDDVFTAGTAKYEAVSLLESLGKFELPVLAIAADRQEVAVDGKEAIAEYQEKTGVKVVSIVNALEIFDYLTEGVGQMKVNPTALTRFANYLRVYGTESARKGIESRFGKLEQKIMQRDRSVIPACDVDTIERFEELVEQTAGVDGIGGYKVGFELGLTYGLPRVTEVVRKHTDKPIIYDHQKAGTDIPDTGKNFARTIKKAGIDTVIFFPQAGPETERAWIYHAFDNGLNVIVGGRMTHPAYAVSEGGFITDEGALDMYRIAARAGVNNFVVPGNKPDVIKQVREVVEAEGASPVFYAPGFIAQGGKISDAAKVAGDKFHGIVGRGIYAAPNMHDAAVEHCSQLS